MSLKIETGTMKGLNFDTVKSSKTRYTPGQLRRTLTNIFDFNGANMLEIFSGSGAVSFEFISNGLKNSYLIDVNGKSISVIKKNAKKLKIEDKINPIKGDFRTVIPSLIENDLSFNYIFADPPFNLGFCDELIRFMDTNNGILKDGGYFILERSKHEKYNIDNLKVLKLDESRNYGDIDIDIYYK
ncbi:MAG: RsmD family RNA methyltransferase [Thermotogota bacterium]